MLVCIFKRMWLEIFEIQNSKNCSISTVQKDPFYSSHFTCNPIRKNFNADLSNWDTSIVTSMHATFREASSFVNGNIGHWAVDKVTSLSRTFRDAALFNADLGGWDISKRVVVFGARIGELEHGECHES